MGKAQEGCHVVIVSVTVGRLSSVSSIKGQMRWERKAEARVGVGVHARPFLLAVFASPSQETVQGAAGWGRGGEQEGRVLVVTTEPSPLVRSGRKCVVSHVEAECP